MASVPRASSFTWKSSKTDSWKQLTLPVQENWLHLNHQRHRSKISSNFSDRVVYTEVLKDWELEELDSSLPKGCRHWFFIYWNLSQYVFNSRELAELDSSLNEILKTLKTSLSESWKRLNLQRQRRKHLAHQMHWKPVNIEILKGRELKTLKSSMAEDWNRLYHQRQSWRYWDLKGLRAKGTWKVFAKALKTLILRWLRAESVYVFKSIELEELDSIKIESWKHLSLPRQRAEST